MPIQTACFVHFGTGYDNITLMLPHLIQCAPNMMQYNLLRETRAEKIFSRSEPQERSYMVDGYCSISLGIIDGLYFSTSISSRPRRAALEPGNRGTESRTEACITEVPPPQYQACNSRFL